MTQLQPGDRAPSRVLVDTGHTPWRIPHTGLLHLQFRRFAGCPVCNLHLASFAQRAPDIEAAGVQELVVFSSTAGAMVAHRDSLPFPIVADPDRALRQAFGAGSSAAAMMSPAAMWQATRGMLHVKGMPMPEQVSATMLLPADLLIAPGGTVVDALYGRTAGQAWTVDELLERAAAAGS